MFDAGVAFASLNVASLVVAMLAGIATARILGPERLGIWSAAAIVLAYIPFLTLGVDHAAAQEIPLHRGAGRAGEAELVRRLYFSFAMPVAVLAGVVVAAYALSARMSGDLRGSLLVVAVLGVMASLARWAVILLKTEHQFAWAGLAEGLKSVVLLAGTPLVLVVGLPGLWAGQVAGSLATVAVAWRRLGSVPRWYWDPVRLRRLVAFGLPIMFVSIAQVLSVTGDRMLVLAFLGTSALGLYGLARTFTQVLMVSGGIVGPVIYPHITERLGQTGDPRRLTSLVVEPTLVLGAILPPAVAAGWVGLPVLVDWLLPAFRPTIVPAQVLFAAAAAYLVAGVSDYLIIAVRRQMLSLGLYAGGVTLGLALEYTALRAGFGLSGVAAGVALSNLVYAVVVIVVAQRNCQVRWPAVLTSALLSTVPLILAVAACVVFDRLVPAPVGAGLLPMLGRAALAMVVLGALTLPLARVMLDRASPRWRATVRKRLLAWAPWRALMSPS